MKVGNSQTLVLEPGYFYMEIGMIDDFDEDFETVQTIKIVDVDEILKTSMISSANIATRDPINVILFKHINNFNLNILENTCFQIRQDIHHTQFSLFPILMQNVYRSMSNELK